MAKKFVVLHGVVATAENGDHYNGAVVEGSVFGDQLERHINNGALREATPAEAKTGIAGTQAGELTIEEQIDAEKASVESSKLRITQLEAQIKERDERAKHADKVRARDEKSGVQTTPIGRVAENK